MSVDKFKYSAYNIEGKDCCGIIEAEDENQANNRLREKGLYPTSITKDSRNNQYKKKVVIGSKDEKERTLSFRITVLLILLTLSLAVNAVFVVIRFFV